MSNFASLPSSNVDEEERQFIIRELSVQFSQNNEVPRGDQVGITVFPDDTWSWHPFYCITNLTETFVTKEDVWSYRSLMLTVNQIDGSDDKFTCRSIVNKDEVIYLLEKLKPSWITKYYAGHNQKILTRGFYILCNYYYNRLLLWQQTYLLGYNESKNMDVDVMKCIMSNVYGKPSLLILNSQHNTHFISLLFYFESDDGKDLWNAIENAQLCDTRYQYKIKREDFIIQHLEMSKIDKAQLCVEKYNYEVNRDDFIMKHDRMCKRVDQLKEQYRNRFYGYNY